MIIPAIIPKSLDDLKEKLELLSFAETIQIDVVDGEFVKDVSWPYDPSGDVEEVREYLGGRLFEVDLMVRDGLMAGTRWLKVGASKLIFHLESFVDRN